MSSVTYVFGLSDCGLIDASTGGNATRHINHSCQPNCVAYEEAGPGGLEIVVYALVSIEQGQELFLDYALSVDPAEDSSNYVCRCESEACRGTMLAVAA